MKHSIAAILLLMVTSVFGQNYFKESRGLPFITNYPPRVYKAHVQNWDATQDNRGIMVFANTDGILMYDASEWRLIPVRDEKSVLCVHASNGRIYSGGAHEFGCLKQNSRGAWKYHSFVHKLPNDKRNFVFVRDVHSFQGKIIYRSESQIMQYTGDTLLVTSAPGKFTNSFVAHSRYFLHDTAAGLLELAGEQLVQVAGTEILKQKNMHFGTPFGNGKLLFSADNQIYTLDITKQENTPKPFKSEAARFLKTYKPHSILQINPDLFAAGTNLNGLIFFDKKGRILRHLNEDNGLRKGSVYNLFKDRKDNLWIMLSNGIARTTTHNTVTYWNSKNGLIGYVADISRYAGGLYLASENGYYHMKKQQISHLGSQYKVAWDLQQLTLPGSNTSILAGASSSGLYRLAPGEPGWLWRGDDLYQLCQSGNNPGLLYAGTKDGIRIFRYAAGRWKNTGKMEGVNANIRSIYEANNGTLWLGTFRAGVFRITPGNNPLKPDAVTHYTTDHGLPSMKNIMVYRHNQHLLFATETGLFRFNRQEERFRADTLLQKANGMMRRGIFAWGKDSSYRVWFSPLNTMNGKPGYRRFNKKYTTIQAEGKISQIPVMLVLSIYPEQDETIWIGGTEGLFRYRHTARKSEQVQFFTLIRRVQLNQDSIFIKGHYNGQKQIHEFEHKYNDVRFEYTAVSFFREENQTYSYKLEGYDQQWSEWTTEKIKDYTNLYEGNYTFKVKARSGIGRESPAAEFRFSIRPPWYRSNWAYAGYVAGFALLMYIGILLNTYRLKAAKRRLQQEVEKRTRQISRQKAEILSQKEEIQAQAEQLAANNKELEKLSMVASKTENSIALFNANLELVWVNRSFERLYGYNPAQWKARQNNTIEELSFHPNIKSIVNSVLEHKQPVTYEVEQKDKYGRKVWVNTTLTPVLNASGEIDRLIAIESDISKLKEAERQILQRNEEINAQKEMMNRQNEIIKNERDKIDRINREMRASIRAALTIQQAILPSPTQMSRIPEHFIIFRPKDIVSGDFYWYSNIQGKKDEPTQVIVAVVDCTGHGVPGAFMSLIGNRMLNEIVNEQNITDPAAILELMDKKVDEALRKENSQNRDGMNLLIANIHQSGRRSVNVVFAAAMNALFYYRQKKGTIERIRGTRRPIGGISLSKKTPFRNHYLRPRQGDILYLPTDGIIDQNAPDRKRFGTPRLIATLQEAATYPLEVQKAYIEQTLDDYQQNANQRDDITLIGIKV